jgi:hypothetical protein
MATEKLAPKTQIRIGPNEFFGDALLWNVQSDTDEIFLPGSVKCHGLQVPLFYEHRQPIGVAALFEFPKGIACRGRVMGSRLVGLAVLNAIKSGAVRGLCLSTQPTKSINDGPVRIIAEAIPTNLSIVICSGIPGTKIICSGEINPIVTEWEARMLEGRFLEELQLRQAKIWAAWCGEHIEEGDGDYAEWLESVRI